MTPFTPITTNHHPPQTKCRTGVAGILFSSVKIKHFTIDDRWHFQIGFAFLYLIQDGGDALRMALFVRKP